MRKNLVTVMATLAALVLLAGNPAAAALYSQPFDTDDGGWSWAGVGNWSATGGNPGGTMENTSGVRYDYLGPDSDPAKTAMGAGNMVAAFGTEFRLSYDAKTANSRALGFRVFGDTNSSGSWDTWYSYPLGSSGTSYQTHSVVMDVTDETGWTRQAGSGSLQQCFENWTTIDITMLPTSAGYSYVDNIQVRSSDDYEEDFHFGGGGWSNYYYHADTRGHDNPKGCLYTDSTGRHTAPAAVNDLIAGGRGVPMVIDFWLYNLYAAAAYMEVQSSDTTWQYDTLLDPGATWTNYTLSIDLHDSTGWTRTAGSGSFADTWTNVIALSVVPQVGAGIDFDDFSLRLLVPEPSTLTLFGIALAMLSVRRRKRRA